MKILFYINGIGGGGAERAMANLANGLSRKGHEIILVTSFPREQEYELSDNIKRYNLEPVPVARRQFIRKNVSRIIKLRKICKDGDCDAAISFMEGPNFRLILSTLKLRTRTIISLRSDPQKEYTNVMHKRVANFIYAIADACVFQTKEALDFFDEKLRRKGTIIFNPVADEFYGEWFSDGTGGIVSVGRLETTKNFELLIRSFSKIAKQFPEEKLTLYGEGSHREQLCTLISELGLEKRVLLAGTVKDIPERIRNAEIFVLSSDYEGMPNALMEAMAMGIPVIATDCPCGGPRALLENGKNGILVPVNNEKKMVRALITLLESQDRRMQFSINAKTRAESFRTDQICEDWQQLLNKVVYQSKKKDKR